MAIELLRNILNGLELSKPKKKSNYENIDIK